MQGIQPAARLAFSSAVLISLVVCATALAGDIDRDGFDDNIDNCAWFSNPLQYDADADGIGNRCDPDVNNDGVVDEADLHYLKSVFFTGDPLADFDTNGAVDFADLAILKRYLGAAAGEPPRLPERQGNANGGLSDGIISIMPASANVIVGDALTLEVWMDFTADPTVGGGFDILFDATRLEFAGWVAAPFGDPAFQREPDPSPGALIGFAIGDIDGLSGPALVGTLSFRAINFGATRVDSEPTSLFLVGPFVSATDFGAQVVEYLDADVDVLRLPGPHILVEPAALDLGALVIGSATNGTITVTSVGDSDLTLGTVGLVDSLSAPFSLGVDGCSGQVLGSASACTIEVVFAPDAAGSFADSFDIASNALEGTNVSVPVTGQGTPFPAPQIDINPLAVNFGDVALAGIGSMEVRIENVGSAPLDVGMVGDSDALAAPFAVLSDACSNTPLVPGVSCLLTLAFFPTAEGLAQESLNVPSNDPDMPDATVSLQGDGVSSVARDVFGRVDGLLNGRLVVCKNLTTGQQVSGVLPNPQPWNCTRLGLTTSAGDEITILIGGVAE